MKLLLDTHVLLWALNGSPRIETVRHLILDGQTDVYVSTASWWEIAIKSGIGKLEANVATLRIASLDSGFVELPVLGAHAETLAALPMLHRDPFDRLLVAQAITEPMQLLTADKVLTSYHPLVKMI